MSAQQFCVKLPSLPILRVQPVSQSFSHVEHSSVEVLGCELKLIHISSWLALRGRVEFALCRSSPPAEDKNTNNVIPRSHARC